MRFLITGGAGFIGSKLSARLIEAGGSVRVIDNLLAQVHGVEPNIDFGDVEFIRGDVRDAEAVRDAMTGVDVVFHLAAETGVGQSQYEIQRYISVNTLGTAVVVEAAVRAGVRHLITTSSRAVYGEGLHACTGCMNQFVPGSRSAANMADGDWEVRCPACGSNAEALPMKESHPCHPISIYGLTKVQQEQIGTQVRQVHSLPVTNLRLFNVFGPGQSLTNPYVGVLGTFFRRIAADLDIDIYEDGGMRRDFVFVQDVVEALRLSAGNQRVFDRSINVGTGQAVTLYEAGLEMFRQLGKPPNVRFSGKFRLGDIHHAVADIGLAAERLGYVPSTSFSEGLAEFVKWARNEAATTFEIDQIAEQQLSANNLLGRARGKHDAENR